MDPKKSPPAGDAERAETSSSWARRTEYSTTRRLPPYGAIVRDRLAERRRDPGTRPWWGGDQVCILVGAGAWRQASEWVAGRLVLAVPPGADPAAYDWRIAAGDADHVPAIYPAGRYDPVHIDALAAELLLAGADRVVAYLAGGSVVYRRRVTVPGP